jgi:hypothetical protein
MNEPGRRRTKDESHRNARDERHESHKTITS